ncbi:tape measure protein [Bacteroides graminisolvens]|uniref:tape measure protein n=1 Tax=Bacteroides graminisolvens TaxID=477666 RepID=UPI0023F235F4|nr:tape measure protein [Bacteroides graminisolvens]
MSENIGGGLAFQATLNIDDFKVSADAMERRIRNVSTTAVQESERMEQSIAAFAQNGARYIIGTLVGGGMMGLVNSIVQTRGQFQQLQIAFDTMLGSGVKSKALIDQLTNTAARTPFDLMGVAGGAKQLLAYGESANKVNDTLVRLGNIASGLSIPLNDIVYLYGTTMVQGRLYAQDVRQFTGRGIPLVRELAAMYGKTAEEINAMVSEGKIGFPEVEKVINKMTNSGGQFYNLMERQSKSLTGMISNLGDSWDMALNKLGEENQGALESGISGAITVVEHLDDVLNVVKAIAIAYGSYRAAIVLNTLATKGYTGVSLIDNTVRQAKIALMKADEAATGKTAAITAKMTAAQEAHTVSLQKQLTVEEQANLTKQLRIATIAQLLTAQQQEYLSNLNLTTSSANYEAVAMSVLSVEQREALSKTDLSAKSIIYQAALEKEVLAKNQSTAATMAAMREDVKAAAAKMEAAKSAAVSSMQAVESARSELYWAKQSGEVTRIAAAEKKLEGVIDNQAIARKTALAASTDFYSKKKLLETTATRQSTVASVADTAAKETQTVATSLLDAATTKLSLGLKALWATMKANPIGWIVSILGIAYSAYEMFFKKQEDGTEAITGLAKATKEATEEFDKQAAKVDTLKKIINDGNIAYFERNKALNELKQIIPSYNAELIKEGKIINDNTDAIEKYLIQLEKQIKLKAAQDELEAAYKKKRTLEKTELSQSDKYWDVKQTNTLQGYNPNSLTAKASRLLGKLNDKNTVTDYLVPDFLIEKEDQAHRALSKTQSDLRDVNDTITELNNEISSTSQSMNESTKSAKTYSEQISETRSQINSIKKEISDLRSGKVLKDNIAEEIENRTKDLKAAETKLSVLTGKSTPTAKSADTAANKAQQLAEKHIQAELKAEQSRIEIMEDGYEKRKALLELQHKQNIAQINKEEKELEKARKEAGKGGLSTKEKGEFDARRTNEDTSYSKAQNKLFDGEIEYKKSQYELYFRWVKNMGEDVANNRFKDLLKSGTSYKDYVEKEIQNLTSKKKDGTISEGESNYLINLNTQLDEITGKKSALDTFKDSFNTAINRASTLAEKLKVIVDYEEKLKNGTSGLVGADDKAAGNLVVSEKKDETDKEVQEKILDDFKSYEAKKDAIIQEYNLLRLQKQVQDNQELLTRINKGESDAISALNAEQLKSSQSWTDLFTNLDYLSAGKIDKLITDIETQMSKANLKLSPVDYNALIDSLNQAKDKVVSLNPFKALGNAVDDYINAIQDKKYADSLSPEQVNKFVDDYNAALEKLKQGEKDNLSPDEIDALKKNVADAGAKVPKSAQQISKGFKDAAIQVAKSISAITDVVGSVGDSIGSIAESYGNEDLANTISNVTGALAGAGQAAGGVGKIMSGDVVGGLMDVTKGVASVITSFNKMHDAKYEKQIKNLQKQIDSLADSYESLGNSIDKAYSTNKADLLNQQNENLQKQNELIQQQIEAEKAKKKTDNDKIKEWQDQIAENNKTIADNTKYSIVEAIMGTDIATAIDDFATAYAEAWASGEKAASKSANVVKNLIKTAIIDQLKNKLQPEVTAFMSYMSEALADGIISDSEQSMLDKYEKKLENISDDYLSKTGSWLTDDSTKSEDPLTGAVKSISEETGGIVAGKLNAVVINQADGLSVLRQSLLYHQQTAANTGASAAELKEIKATLSRIENKDSSLLSKGIS